MFSMHKRHDIRRAIALGMILSYCALLSIAQGSTASFQEPETATIREKSDASEILEAHEELRICFLVDSGITQERVNQLSEAMRIELSNQRIKLTVPWSRPWTRSAFARDGLLSEISRIPLEAPCDRLVALLGRHVGDFLYGLVAGIEVLGAIELVTHTRGYIVAERGSINQLFISPTSVAAHETFHLLGCKDSDGPAECRAQIHKLSEAARKNRNSGKDFFPGFSINGQMIVERDLSDLLLTLWYHQEELEACFLPTEASHVADDPLGQALAPSPLAQTAEQLLSRRKQCLLPLSETKANHLVVAPVVVKD